MIDLSERKIIQGVETNLARNIEDLDNCRKESSLIEYQEETYITVAEVARQFGISRSSCYTNLLPQMRACHLPGRKRALYRQSDVEQFAKVRIVEKPYRNLPVSTSSAAETGSAVTSSPNFSQWAGLASIANPASKNNRKETAYDEL